MHTNALIHEKSPYLRQHAHNPVDWMPWGEAAFEKAREEDKPIFLSIGYSTCHWCHVMAHESFEDERIAEVLNRHFVPIKIDREERPDVDRIYMLYVQATTGSGGWPMSVFLTPDLKPFYGGTYFPPGTRYGRPGFRDILEHLGRAWKQERSSIESSSDKVVDQLDQYMSSAKSAVEPDRALLDMAYSLFERSFDERWGGFGGAPKFPRPVTLNFLLRYHLLSQNEEALEMVLTTLRAMAAGGMHDQLGGGFHRYSVDERWFVPHFEKMMYDQAQLAASYVEAYQITQDEQFANVAGDIFDYVLRDITDSEGGFYSAEDADSADPEKPEHSGEGSFYIWRKSEIASLLGAADAESFCKRFGVEENGNVENDPHGEFGGRNILYQASSPPAESEDSLHRSAETLFAAREKRPRPHLDGKVLTSWNGLMISALAKASYILDEPRFLKAAERALAFVLAKMYDAETGQLLRRYCDGEAAVPGFLDDYAFLIQALLDLFEANCKPEHLQLALDLAQRGLAQFADPENGGFFSTPAGAPDLLLRMKDDYDGAEPSGNSIATDVLLRLAHLTGDPKFGDAAEASLRSFAPKLKAQAQIAPQMLVAVDRWLAIPEQIVIRCERFTDEVEHLLDQHRSAFRPHTVVLAITDAAARALQPIAPFLASLERKGKSTLYVCQNLTCELPVVLEA